MTIRCALPALLAVSGALAGPARATPATATVETTSGPDAAECPGAEALAAAVNDGLGRAALAPAGAAAPAAPVRVAVHFERAAQGYAATVSLGGGTRTLSDEGAGCAALANAVGVLLTVLLDSSAETLSAGAARPAPRATTADVGVGAGVAEGLVGGWSPAVGLGATLAYRRFAGRLGGVWVPATSGDFGPGRVQVGLALARLALCVSTRGGRTDFSVSLCGQQQIGALTGRGADYEAGNRAAHHLWLAAGASVMASGPLGRALGWEIEAGVVRLLRQERFVVDNLGAAFQSDPFAFVTTFALTTRVW